MMDARAKLVVGSCKVYLESESVTTLYTRIDNVGNNGNAEVKLVIKVMLVPLVM